jgi:Trk K+ transport system NAD-binding subunit
VGLLTRFGAGQLAKPETVIQSGDSLHVLTPEDHVKRLREVATRAPEGGSE